jgi:F-type H+-transporting ATPase subunit gamma
MPKGGKEIRRRIRSVRNTQQITKAMKMVAAARLRKSEGRTQASRPYSDTLQEVMRRLGTEAEELEHAYLNHLDRGMPRVLLLLMTSDRGLCGAFNTNILRRARRFSQEMQAPNDLYPGGRQVELVCAGKKGAVWARGHGLKIAAQYPSFTHQTTYADLAEVTQLLTGSYLAREVSEVYLIYARFLNVMRSAPTVVRLLPIEKLPQSDERDNGYHHEYLLEPSPQELLAKLMPSYFRALLFQAALENFTSENGARMVAMDKATSAAGEMIDKLTLEYNKARQAAITLELLDIVGGAEAIQR